MSDTPDVIVVTDDLGNIIVDVTSLVTEVQVVDVTQIATGIEVVDVGTVGGPKGDTGAPGEDGEPGDTGPPGPTGGVYVHTQSVPSALWLIIHGLDYNPNVTIVDSAGSQVEGDVIYSAGMVTAEFSAAFGGTAYLS